jgi:hypothetical protein
MGFTSFCCIAPLNSGNVEQRFRQSQGDGLMEPAKGQRPPALNQEDGGDVRGT